MNTNSNLSWLDSDNLRALASAAGLSGGAPLRTGGPGVVRRAETVATRPVAAPAPPVASSPMRQRLGVSAQHPQAPVPEDRPQGLPPFAPPQAAAMGQRLNAFIDWLFRNLPCQRVFIADGDGLPLAQRHSNIDLIGISTVLMDASKQLRSHLQLPEEASIGLELGGNEMFQLLQLQMPWQEVSLGIIIRGYLARDLVDQVKAALRSALEFDQGPESAAMAEPDTAVAPLGDPSQENASEDLGPSETLGEEPGMSTESAVERTQGVFDMETQQAPPQELPEVPSPVESDAPRAATQGPRPTQVRVVAAAHPISESPPEVDPRNAG